MKPQNQPSISWRASPLPLANRPYKGLEYFDTADAGLFFGRERLTERLVHHLKQSHFLALVGASGSGKSSVARAGVIPALAPSGWHIVLMTPTDHPLQALANSLNLEQGFIRAGSAVEPMRIGRAAVQTGKGSDQLPAGDRSV
jgi:hypothetical protein